jgi:peptide/nickel transport system permease protein
MSAVCILIVFFVIGVTFLMFRFANVDWPYNPNDPHLADKLQPPGAGHPLGTDNLGRDVLSRILHGAYISLTVGFLAMGVSVTIGIVVGSIAGYFGGWVDNAVMRVVDAIMCFPTFFLILTVIALLGPSIWNVIIVIGLVGWTGCARLVRAEFLSLREMEYVRAARALGQRDWMIIFRHILPNALAPVYVTAVLDVAGAIMTEAGLSFLGFGVQPPQASWGNIIADGKTYILDAWWLILFPGVAIFVTTLAFYLTGEGLRQAFEQKESKS